jgi:hypothetical protein
MADDRGGWKSAGAGYILDGRAVVARDVHGVDGVSAFPDGNWEFVLPYRAMACCLVLVAPRVRSNYSVMRGERILWTPVRKALERRKAALEAWDTTPTNLTLSEPVVPRESILFIQGRYELLAVPEYTEEVWQKWKQPEIWRLPHGHVSWMFAPGITNRVLDWLVPRLEAGRKNNS